MSKNFFSFLKIKNLSLCLLMIDELLPISSKLTLLDPHLILTIFIIENVKTTKSWMLFNKYLIISR